MPSKSNTVLPDEVRHTVNYVRFLVNKTEFHTFMSMSFYFCVKLVVTFTFFARSNSIDTETTANI